MHISHTSMQGYVDKVGVASTQKRPLQFEHLSQAAVYSHSCTLDLAMHEDCKALMNFKAVANVRTASSSPRN